MYNHKKVISKDSLVPKTLINSFVGQFIILTSWRKSVNQVPMINDFVNFEKSQILAALFCVASLNKCYVTLLNLRKC